MTNVDPANVRPGEFAPVPTSRDDLLIEALRFANRVSGLLNDIRDNVMDRIESDNDHRFDDLHEMILRQYSDCSAVHLFISANNLRIELPADLRAEYDED